jgi:hypothetical protein
MIYQGIDKSGGFECTIATKGWEVLINGYLDKLNPRLIIAKTSPLILMPVKSLPIKLMLSGLIPFSKIN